MNIEAPLTYLDWLKQIVYFKGGWQGVLVALVTVAATPFLVYWGFEFFPPGRYPRIVLALPGLAAGAGVLLISSALLWPLLVSRQRNAAQTSQKKSADNRSYSKSDSSSVRSSEGGRGFWVKLVHGDFGLAKTFWIFNFLANLLANALLTFSLTISTGLYSILFAAYLVYIAPVMVGVWRAANKYNGAKIWAVLAKIIVIVAVSVLAISLLLLLAQPGLLS